MKVFPVASAALALAAALSAYTALTPDRAAILTRISADSLAGHVSFLASDLLEGRGTPSRGLDLAAEYIAAQFRRAGLTPAGDNGYFQTAPFVVLDQAAEGAALTLKASDKEVRIENSDLRIQSPGNADFGGITPVVVDLHHVKPEDVAGRVMIAAADRAEDLHLLSKLEPSAAIVAHSGYFPKSPPKTHWLKQASGRRRFPVVQVYDREFSKLVRSSKADGAGLRLSLHLPPCSEALVNLRNVAGILPGSDPELKDTYVLITAHYDHLGKNEGKDGDPIFNGANDDASGVASVIEIASSLAAARPRPRRSLLFMAYFGEEEGLLGSRYYGSHPLFPLKQTVADLNLEHLGRTDGDGRGAGTATMTGFGYSDITTAFERAGGAVGVKIYNTSSNGEEFFARSDNQSLADHGIPSTTILTTFEFPDYHKTGDKWQKLDYSNMEKVDRTIALTVMMIADDPQAPRWNESNSKTEKYVQAWRELK